MARSGGCSAFHSDYMPVAQLERRRLLLASAAVLLGVVPGCLSTRTRTLPARARAHDFSTSSHTGDTVSLAELTRDGPAVLVFYRGYW